MQMNMKCKLGLLGHICLMDNSCLINPVKFGSVEGKSKVGRPRSKWTDDLIEWSVVSFSTLKKMAKDKKEWKKKTNVIVGTYGQHNA